MTQPHSSEPLWHVELAIIFAVGLQLILADRLTIGPKYLIAVLELLLVFGLRLSSLSSHSQAARVLRLAGVGLTALVSFANITSLILVCRYLIRAPDHVNGRSLILSAIAIYLTNIILFGLWYWQLDGGGPIKRAADQKNNSVDFLFPQMSAPDSLTLQKDWRPSFFDYLYVSVTNGSAFSPTDTMPLTHRAKLLMTIQALASLLTVALVAARAINILN